MFNMSCAIIACLKQEELYIKEWLDWHISIGVDHFYLCDNNDKDYFPKLQNIVKEYIDKGIVEVFDYNDVHPIQPICYIDIYDRYGNLYDWWLVIDIDEFLVLPAYNDKLKLYLSVIPNHIDRIYIWWRNYGDNDLIKYENKPILERFTKPSILAEYSDKGKSLFRNKTYLSYKYREDIQIVHQHYINNIIFDYSDVYFNKSIYCGTESRLNDVSHIKYDCVYLKHFRTKSLEEWIWRNQRGDTLKDKDHEKYPYKLHYFWTFNKKTPEKENYLNNYKSNL